MTKFMRVGQAALVATFLLAPALAPAVYAQPATSTSPTMTTTPGTGGMQANRGRGDGFDWGLLGLLGLVGLAPLFMRRDRGTVHTDVRR